MIKHGIFRYVPWKMSKAERDRSGGYIYREKHGLGVEACCPAFPLPEPVQAHVPRIPRPRMATPDSAIFPSSEQCCAY